LIVEVEEVGRVADSVRSLSFTNHQSPIINHPAYFQLLPIASQLNAS